jgi:hypothetical protein
MLEGPGLPGLRFGRAFSFLLHSCPTSLDCLSCEFAPLRRRKGKGDLREPRSGRDPPQTNYAKPLHMNVARFRDGGPLSI